MSPVQLIPDILRALDIAGEGRTIREAALSLNEPWYEIISRLVPLS